MIKMGSTQKKILLALLGGLALGSSSSPRKYFRTLEQIHKDWKNITRGNIKRSVLNLCERKLIEINNLADGSMELSLTSDGRKRAELIGVLNNCSNIKSDKKWDKKWRIVIFDVPEKNRMFREVLREHLNSLGFVKLQNSVFVSPYSFEELILNLVSLYAASKYVRVITADFIDNERKLKRQFFGRNNLS